MQGDDTRGLYDHYPRENQLYGPRAPHMAEDQQPWPTHGSATHRGLTNPPSDSTTNEEPRQQTSVQLPGYTTPNTHCTSPSYALGHGGQKATNQQPEPVATTPRQSNARVDWLDGIPPMDIAANRAYPIGEAGARWGRLNPVSSVLVPRSFYPDEQGFVIPADPGHSDWGDRNNVGEGHTIRGYTELGSSDGPSQGELTGGGGNARGAPREMTQESAGDYDRTLRPASSTSTSTSTSGSALTTLSRRRSSVPLTSVRITSASASASCDDHHGALAAAAAAAAAATAAATASAESSAKEYAANVSNATSKLHTASSGQSYVYAPVSLNYNITNINHNKSHANSNDSDDNSPGDVDDNSNDGSGNGKSKGRGNNIPSSRQNSHQHQYPHAPSYADAHYYRNYSPSRPAPSAPHNTGATTHPKHYPYLKSCDHSPASVPSLGPSPLPNSPPFNLYDTARTPGPAAYREMLDIDPETKGGTGLGLGPHYALESNLRSTIKMEPVSLEYQDLQKIPMAPPPKPRANSWLMHVRRGCTSSKETSFSRSMPNLAPQSATASASCGRTSTLVREAPAPVHPITIDQPMQSTITASAVTQATTTTTKSPVVKPPLSKLDVPEPPAAIDKVQDQARMTSHESHTWHLQPPRRGSSPCTKSVEVLPRGSTLMLITETGAGGPSAGRASLPSCGSDNGQKDRLTVLSRVVFGKFSATELETSMILTEMSRQPHHSNNSCASAVATSQPQHTLLLEDTEMVDQQAGDCDQTQKPSAQPPSPPIAAIRNPYILIDCAKLIKRYIGSGYTVANGPLIANKMSEFVEYLNYHANEMLRLESRFTSAALEQWVSQNPDHEGYTCMTKMTDYLGKISYLDSRF